MGHVTRGCGIFLPVSSLPSPYGVGGFGEEAHRFINLIADAGVRYWQVFPFAYSYGSISPYHGQASFAKHHLMLDPGNLVVEGLLTTEEAAPEHPISERWVKHHVLYWKHHLVARAYKNFAAGKAPHLGPDFRAYVANESDWLVDFALYAALTHHFHFKPWQEWPRKLRERDPHTLYTWELALHTLVQQELFAQFLLDRQWQSVRSYAHDRRVSIIGDLPIYSARDSMETWQYREYFQLDEKGHPARTAGAPPDMFNEHGQSWGFPTYRWANSAKEGYAYHLRRITSQLRDVDILRIDHFLGYARYWSIPPHKHGSMGCWVRGPGNAFFDTLKKVYPPEQFIMDDLGFGSPGTERILHRFGAPGMRVMCLELDGVAHFDDAITYKHPTVAYTSTHDTDTLMGWYRTVPTALKRHMLTWWKEKGVHKLPIQFRFISLLLQTSAPLVLIPLQDVLGLGTSSRLNTPGTGSAKTWAWRFTWDDLSPELLSQLRELIEASAR